MIAPENLLIQARRGAPWLFEGEPARPWLERLRHPEGEYYGLCLAAHWATAGCFSPTDVDNAIRYVLWQDAPAEKKAEWAKLVVEALSWDYGPVTARLAFSPSGERVSTHEGTWFSVAVGAYAATRAPAVFEAMLAEAEREARLFRDLLAAKDGLGLLKASALLSHNFGDLDRVADQWGLKADDPLKRALYDAAKPGSALFGGILGKAGALNQRFMTTDNHRHYPLRAAKALRTKPELLLPVGPFFDEWGAKVARLLPPEDVGEAVRALVDGWARLHEPPGYARALSGIQEAFPGGREALRRHIPSRDLRLLSTGSLRKACDEPRARFEARLNAAALKALGS